MPLGHFNIQWLNQNAQRSYPLTDWATCICPTAPTVIIPDSFLLALYLPIHAGLDVDPDKFYLQSLGIFATGYSLAIGYDDGSSSPPMVATVNIARSTHTENRSYALTGVDNFDDSVGKVVIGRLDDINALPPGLYYFDYAAGALETDCIRPMIRGISSITVVNGLDRSEKLYGDITFVAGENMRLRVSTADANPRITWDAIDGEGLNEECVCDESAEGPCIRTINGIPPYPDGTFRLYGNECIEVRSLEHGLRFSDKCSEPCCGCEELDAIVQQLHRFSDGVTTLEGFVTRLQTAVDGMHNSILASRLGTQGCVEC